MPAHQDRHPELPRDRVERELRARLTRMEPGAQLPPVPELAAELRSGHGTIRTVLAKLAAEDPPLVKVIPHYGTFRT